MITRELVDGRTILLRQEDHAELAAQFAAHWGNKGFARPRPYDTVVNATAYHDTHFRDVEAELLIDFEHGRPYGFRSRPFSPAHLAALRQNIEWVASRDPYAALLVSMHHTGLQQNRYGVINYSWLKSNDSTSSFRRTRPEAEATARQLEQDQRASIQELSRFPSAAEEYIRLNYRLLQVFDLLSLYLCCDGYVDGGLKEATLGPVPVAYEPAPEVNLHIVPTRTGSLRFDPYPFDRCPLKVSVAGRVVRRLVGHSEAECRAEFYNAEREYLTWNIAM